jgi:DNA/RNA endonuclease G (NUC1)
MRNSSPRRPYLVVVSLAVFFISMLQVRAIIGTAYQMQLGNPSGATADPNNHNHYLIQRTVEAMDYSDALGEPVWVSWDLTSADVGSFPRSDKYFPDTNLPPTFYVVTDNDYNGVGNIQFNRGHMCPSEDRTDTRADNDMLFFMSNIIPQAANNNQGVWGDFEGYCRTLANSGNEILIICGPSGFGTNRIPSGKAVIADNVWKIAVVVPLGAGTVLSRINASTRVISLKIPNNNSVSSPWQNYVTSARQLQIDTGFAFFTALPSNLAWVLRSKVDAQTPPAPLNVGFSPISGATNTSITITGTNLDSTTNVTFNGTSASFTIVSPTQINATVPYGATSGHISVANLGGTLTTSSNFTVTGSAPDIDLAVITTHAASFTQGDVGDSYTIIVTNMGTVAAVGTVTLADTLPAGLSATAIGGTGWSADLGTLTCTRSDSLAGGASYPPITVTVNVSASAPASVTNTVTVSGGGDANPANNTVYDSIAINSSGVTAPTIASQPQPQTVNVGQAAIFSVTANGTAPLGYQWQFNGGAIAGATLSSYTRSNAQLADAGIYSVVVSNSAGIVVSSNALLTVINGGGGSTNILAQWNFNSVPPDGSTGTGTNAASMGSGSMVMVGGVSQTYFGGSTNDPAPVADNSGLSTAAYPTQGTGNKTAGLRVNVNTVGYQNISLNWDQRLSATASKYFRLQYTTNGTDFVDYNVITMASNGAFETKTNNFIGLMGVDNNPNFAFRIVAEFESTAIGTANVNYVTTSTSGYGTGGTVRYDMLTVYGTPIPSAVAPSITFQPQSQTSIAGNNVMFGVTASGTAPLAYQWKFNNDAIVGATNGTLLLSSVTTNQAGLYSVVVSNSAGAITSSNALLSVYPTAAATVSSFVFSGSQAQFSVTGVPGYNYAVQVSTNLIDWTSIRTNASPFTLTDTNVAGAPYRFYRTVYLP